MLIYIYIYEWKVETNWISNNFHNLGSLEEFIEMLCGELDSIWYWSSDWFL
jgi:hypothetical protein